MSDVVLIVVPLALAMFFLGLVGIVVRCCLFPASPTHCAAAAGPLRRDVAIFVFGAMLVAAYFLFNAGFFIFLG